MAHDGSLASQVEAWIVGRLQTIDAFADQNVEVFKGSTKQDIDLFVDELLAGQSPKAVVLFEEDRPVELEAGENAYDPTYGVYVGVLNYEPGTARTGVVVGAATKFGTNGLRDLMRNALHDLVPGLSANGFSAERSEFRGVRVVFARRDLFVMRAEVVVREVPTP
jgi:hypothetical protein